MRKWISREEEASFPEFDSFHDAWMFFVAMYDKDMMLETVEEVDGVKCYFCALVIDWDVYREMLRAIVAGRALVGMKYIECRQPIQIFEDGRVHIVH